jgi:cell wall-associated NlpC family hydrolase
VATGTVTRVKRGSGPLRDGARAGHAPSRARRAWRASAPAAGALAALLATAAGWPGSPQPSTPRAAADGTSPAAQAWLLSRTPPAAIPAPSPRQALPKVAPLQHLLTTDLVAVSAKPLPAGSLAAIRHLHGVHAAQAVDAAQVQVNGRFVAVLGVNPSQFRGFAAKPTARDTAFWRSVAAGNLGISYTMGKQDKLPVGSSVTVAGRHIVTMSVGRLGTVGIGGIDAVVSDAAADSLGFPEHNAIVINATRKASFAALAKRIKKVLPHSAAVDQVAVQPSQPGSSTAPTSPAGSPQPTVSGLLTLTQLRTVLSAAESRVGMPYVWGAAGPTSFDCSGLVQWSFRQAGIVMPRVAADQARTGPSVPVKDLQPGDLLFYHTDPTAPGYISHVAMYLGNGRMIQAPQPGMDVEIVPVDLSDGFAGAIEVSPTIAAQAAATSV